MKKYRFSKVKRTVDYLIDRLFQTKESVNLQKRWKNRSIHQYWQEIRNLHSMTILKSMNTNRLILANIHIQFLLPATRWTLAAHATRLDNNINYPLIINLTSTYIINLTITYTSLVIVNYIEVVIAIFKYTWHKNFRKLSLEFHGNRKLAIGLPGRWPTCLKQSSCTHSRSQKPLCFQKAVKNVLVM